MKKSNVLLLIIGAILTIVPYFINIYNIFRLISLLLGIILVLLGLILNAKRKLLKIILYPIGLIALCFALDYVVCFTSNNIPIIAIAHKSSSKVITYDSLLYRVYDCEDVLTFDANYEKDYLCNGQAIKMISINKFLENPKESYKESKGKFVHLQGKINTIVGTSSLVLNTYDEKVELNGYVTFNTGKQVAIDDLDINPAEYYVYDLIEVIGLVSSYEEKDDVVVIHLSDAKVLKSDVYKEYELLVNNINDLEKTKVDEKLYYLGLQGIFYKYDENNIYEIDYLLLDKRETLENLVKDVTPSMIDDVHELFELESYNLIKCASGDIIFANKDITNLKNACDFEDEN